MAKAQSLPLQKKQNRTWKYLKQHKFMYLMLVPLIVYYIIFHYLPMFGAVIAFKDFKPRKGIWASPWVGLEHFRYLFGMSKFKSVVFNTIKISLTRLVFGFPFPIIVALLMNELRSKKHKKAIQSMVILPEFLSWVVLGGIMTNLLSADGGVVNNIIKIFGGQPVSFLADSKTFIPTMVVFMIWKTFGWNTVIYMAALTGIDNQLYEAATIDGASRLQQMFYVTLPGIKGIIVTMLIMRIGSLMQAGFEQIFVLYNPGVYDVADIIDTYVYRLGLSEGKFELASAVGLFKSVINFILLVVANSVARMTGEEGVY